MSPAHRDEGAIAFIVAILFGTGVLLGCAALTIDVGNINLDRRQLQNGADAVALAVAQQCVKDGTCNPNDPDLQRLANLNAATSVNRASEIRRVDGETPAVCGNASGLEACPKDSVPSMQNLQECPSEIADGVNYVRVYTETKNADTGHNILPYYFGAMVVGVAGANQQACASVSWGQPGAASNTMPMVLNECGWNAATANGTKFGPSQPSPAPRTSESVPAPQMPAAYLQYAIQFYTHTKNGESATTCGDRKDGGEYFPGGFGWVNTTDNAHCSASFTNDNGLWSMSGSNGAAAPDGCKAESLLKFVGTTVYIPIVTAVSGTNYTINGLAAFYVAGYRAPAVAQPNDFNGYSGGLSVLSPNEGLWGWFTKPIGDVGSGDGTGTPRGPIVISITG
jgi:hypothetical protein